MKSYFLIFLFFSGFYLSAQIKHGGVLDSHGTRGVINLDSISHQKDSLRSKVPKLPATDYKIFTLSNDTISVDTTLSIRRYYRFNPQFRDDFAYLSFQNMGQALTRLTLEVQAQDLLGGFVATSKLADDWHHTQISFFKTPTPYSDLSYINGISQGQFVNAVFATNINSQLNIAAGYRGLSSLGFYQRSIVGSGRFFGDLNYQNKSGRYKLKAYYYTFEKTNDENGGLKDPSQFETGSSDFADRSRIEVNLSDAQNQLKKRRLFIGQSYGVLKNKFSLLNRTVYQSQQYRFTQDKPNDILGHSSQVNSKFQDSVSLKTFENFAGLQFKIHKIQLESGLRFIYQNYSFDSIKQLNGRVLPRSLIYKDLALDSKLQVQLGRLSVKGQLNIGVTDNIAGYFLKGDFIYKLPRNFVLSGQFKSVSKRPDFKYILYQSAYDKFNWYEPSFKNELIQQLKAQLSHKTYGKLSLNQVVINNYTFFGRDSLPQQDATGINYAALKYSNDFYYKHWGLSADILFQKVLSGEDLISIPSYILRSTLFYSHYYFQHNLYVQTGVTAKYFEAFYARSYNPIVADFNEQRFQKIGAYPLIDYFINFKIKRFRFYFKLQHLNALLNKDTPDYYVAPLQPYRDFNIRFGLRWIFFN